jgi:ribulose-phosphate 3-epimerase
MNLKRKKILAPSILAGNHANLCESLLIAERDGREWIHLDIMDGHFVPNLSFGPQTVADLRKSSSIFFDVHLMLDQPDRYIEPFINAGADLISIHLEPDYDHLETLSRIKKAGLKNGMVINPDTPIDGLVPYLDKVDLVLFMTVFPGFGGQEFIYEVLSKAKDISKLREEKNLDFLIEVDGGVGPDHIKPCMDAGVDIFVAGTAYYKLDQSGRREFADSIENPDKFS